MKNIKKLYHENLPIITKKYPPNCTKRRYELIGEVKNRQIHFLKEESAIKIIIACRATTIFFLQNSINSKQD